MSRQPKRKLNEKKIWIYLNQFQKKHKRAHFTKIESATINGIPDVHCCFEDLSFWLELKANQVKNLNISKYQIAWHLNHTEAGGLCFIMNWPLSHVPPKLYEIREPGVPVPVSPLQLPTPISQIMSWMASQAA